MTTQIKPNQLDLSGDGTTGVGTTEGVLIFSDVLSNGYLFLGEGQGDSSLGPTIRTTGNFLSCTEDSHYIVFDTSLSGTAEFIVAKQDCTDAATQLFRIESDGTASVLTASYETLVIDDNDIPNKKYVDDLITNILITPGDLLACAGDSVNIVFDSNNTGSSNFVVSKGDCLSPTDLFTVENDGTLSVQTVLYETLITNNNDIPNKKYVDDLVSTVSLTGTLDFKEYFFTATTNQTVFSGFDDFGKFLTYTSGTLIVYLNGVRLHPNDFIALDGSTVTLLIPTIESDILTFATSTVTNTLTFYQYTYTASNGQTTFTGIDDYGLVLLYEIDSIEVYLNGVRLTPTEFTAIDKYTVDLTAPAALNDIIQIVAQVPSTASGVFRNVMINGNFDIWQRGTSFPSVADATVTADRWSVYKSGGVTAVADVIRSSDTPDLSSLYSFDYTITTAQASLAASDYLFAQHIVEGNNYRSLLGKEAVLSFKVKSNLIGTYCISFRNIGQDRTYIVEYTITAADTWEYKSVVVPLTEIGGTWNYDNDIGLDIVWCFGAGTTYQTPAGLWNTSNFLCSANQTNLAGSVSNYIRLSQVQFETGSRPASFQHRTIQEELLLCKRYYQKSFDFSVTPAQALGFAGTSIVHTNGAGNGSSTVQFTSDMRSLPTIITYNPTQANANWRRTDDGSDGTFSLGPVNSTSVILDITGSTADSHFAIGWTADAELTT